MSTERREGSRLDFEPEQGRLVVGGRTAVLDATPPAEAVVGTYVELVVAQRALPPTSRADLRDRELVQLADLLQLPPAALDALIDRELARLLGGPEHDADRGGAPRRRWTLAFGAIAVVAAAALAAASAAGGASSAEPEPGSTVETITLPDGSTATRTESAPAPAGDGVDIGTAVQIERTP